MFVFGAQYLRGATPSKDQWARDMESMQKMGFNTIRAWLVWNALEPKEGEIDTASVGEFLDLAENYGLQVGLLFHLHACPAWAAQKYPEYWYVDENGASFEPAVRPNTPSGGWPGLCFDHEEVREIEKRFIEGIMAETKKHKNVAFYEPMNEPHEWIDFAKSPAGTFCYCGASVKKFRAWLRKKYGTVEALNEAWGHFYGSFDEVRPPRWTISYSDYTDFRLFTMDNIVEEIAYRSEIIRANDDKPVFAHAWGGGAVTCSNLGGMAFDDWKNAQVFDKWGYSAFPNSLGDASMLGMGSDATRCAAEGKEYWQSELSAGMVGTGLNQKGRLDDNTFLNFSIESLRHGAHGLLYWQYRKERFGAEFGGFSMTDNAGGPTNLSRAAEKVCRMTQKNADILLNAKTEPAQIALIFSVRSFIAAWLSNNRQDNRYAVDSLGGYYRMFWEENIPVDILHEEIDADKDLSRYKLIIAPSPYALSPVMAEKIRKYVEDGGTFLSDPYFGAFDETMKLSYTVPGFGFERVFGCVSDDIRMCSQVELTDGNGKRRFIEGNRQLERYRDVTARTLYSYADGSPAIVENVCGKGRAVASGVNLGLPYASCALVSDDILSKDKANSSEDAKRIVLEIAEKAGVTGNLCTAVGVKASVLTAPEGMIVMLINSNQADAEGAVALPYCRKGRVSEELGRCGAKCEGDFLRFTLGAGESAVVRIEKIKAD